jgi:hypothetical protein
LQRDGRAKYNRGYKEGLWGVGVDFIWLTTLHHSSSGVLLLYCLHAVRAAAQLYNYAVFKAGATFDVGHNLSDYRKCGTGIIMVPYSYWLIVGSLPAYRSMLYRPVVSDECIF